MRKLNISKTDLIIGVALVLGAVIVGAVGAMFICKFVY